MDDPKKAVAERSEEGSALNMFRQMDLKGRGAGQGEEMGLRTVHQNTINTVRAFEEGEGGVTRFSTSG